MDFIGFSISLNCTYLVFIVIYTTSVIDLHNRLCFARPNRLLYVGRISYEHYEQCKYKLFSTLYNLPDPF